MNKLASLFFLLYFLLPASGFVATPQGGAVKGVAVKDSVLRIPDGVAVIEVGEYAWRDDFHTVILPSSLRKIERHAFAYCPRLREVKFNRNLQKVGCGAFAFCSELREVELPATVTLLDSYAFVDCLGLRRIVLPANRKMLGELILSGCRALQEVTIMSPEPPEFDCNSTLFEGTEPQMYRQCRLIVPPGAEEKYRTAPGWSLFFNPPAIL